jgi:lipopolysaccharide transport system permease protein
MGIFTTTLMFVSPIFYPVTALPEAYRRYLYMNPLTPIIEQVRNVLFWSKAPDFLVLLNYGLIAIVIAWIGFAWFQKTRKGFADVL